MLSLEKVEEIKDKEKRQNQATAFKITYVKYILKLVGVQSLLLQCQM